MVTPEEIEKMHINWERGFYVEFRDGGKLYAGKDPEKAYVEIEMIEWD
jgi:hypothetical protein